MTLDSVTKCERCGSNIVENGYYTSRSERPERFRRELGRGEYATDEIRLCSMCLDDVWEFVFEAEIDRSDKSDPIPMERLSENVTQHIRNLERILDEIESLDNE